jgi:hypothetical protein
MANHSSRRRRLRLRRELHLISGAVEAARILGEAVATDQLGPERDHRRAPRAITSLLTLVEARLRVLRRTAWRGGDPEGPEVPEAAGPEPLSSDERVLAVCAMRQRASGLRGASEIA